MHRWARILRENAALGQSNVLENLLGCAPSFEVLIYALRSPIAVGLARPCSAHAVGIFICHHGRVYSSGIAYRQQRNHCVFPQFYCVNHAAAAGCHTRHWPAQNPRISQAFVARRSRFSGDVWLLLCHRQTAISQRHGFHLLIPGVYSTHCLAIS